MRWQDVIQGLQIRRRRLPKVARWRAVRARHRLLLPTRHGEGLLSKGRSASSEAARLRSEAQLIFKKFDLPVGGFCLKACSLPIEGVEGSKGSREVCVLETPGRNRVQQEEAGALYV